MSDGVVKLAFHEYRGEWEAVEEEVIEEGFVSIFVNGLELATVMSSPREQDRLALGFLHNEGIIHSLDDVRALHVCPSGACVDVWLKRDDFVRPERLILTSGCGGGVTFDDLSKTMTPLDSTLTIAPQRLSELMIAMQQRASLYARARGVHTSALSDGEQLIVLAEDVGRHNTIDKLRGACLLQGIDPAGRVLLCTGRISSEMINKAARMGCPIVASRTSPTSLSVQLARQWNITLVGYVRRESMNVYTHPERLKGEGRTPATSHRGQAMKAEEQETTDG
ncbi:MAG TPA: formate dehydrogenase accessory sulfurtransferase FdhD [Anaerolineae bacterium]|nr:formate dehydrogenase accessory sulfurtransferase FdhD [Anaerolineae bacterium]